MKDVIKLFAFVLFCELVGLAAAPITITAIPAWYAVLNKPPFAPPNWIFGPVWTLLYALMGIAWYLVLRKGLKNKYVRAANIFFIAQLTVNFLWTPLFFGLRSPLLGLIDIVALSGLIVMTMNMFYKVTKPAAFLLIPYLFWVSFATVLNTSILILNG